MDEEWFKSIVGTFNHGFFALNQIEDIDAALGMVRNALCKPMPARFDEFQWMQPGLFFAPAIAAAQWFDLIY